MKQVSRGRDSRGLGASGTEAAFFDAVGDTAYTEAAQKNKAADAV
jgi:hypothetical protein